MISSEHLQAIKDYEQRTVEVMKSALEGGESRPSIVAQVKKNIIQIVGSVSRVFLYRQTNWDEDHGRRNVLARLFDVVAAIYFTNEQRGEELMRFVESFFAYLRSTKVKTTANFIDLQEKVMVLNTRRLHAGATGDKQTARELTAQIVTHESVMPQALRKATL